MVRGGTQRGLAMAGIVGAFLALGWRAAGLTRVAWRPPPTTREELAARNHALPANAFYRQRLALLDLAAGRSAMAHVRLVGAVHRAPLIAELWRSRARAALAAGKSVDARLSAQRAVTLAPVDSSGCYDAALVLLQAGDRQGAAPALRCVLHHSERIDEILTLAHDVYDDPAFVLREVLPPGRVYLEQYLDWAQAEKQSRAAALAWATLHALGPDSVYLNRRVEYLIASGDAAAAEPLWVERHGARSPAGVFDGDFEGDAVGGGFGWRLEDSPEEWTARVASGTAAAHGSRGLAIEFKGGNVYFHHVRQYVPVRGGRRYFVTGLVRSENLTSLSGPHLVVQATKSCPELRAVASPEFLGTRDWQPFWVELTTPERCTAVELFVQRNPTGRLDRELRGRLYLDDVRLEDAGAAPLEGASAQADHAPGS